MTDHLEFRSADRTHVPHLEPRACNQRPKTNEHRDLKLYRYGETDLYQWWSKRGTSVFEDPCDEPFVILSAPRAPVGETGELPLPCYVMSEPHLSGYRIILGYETLTESMDAQVAFARLARGLVHSLVPAVLPGGDRPDRVAPGPMGAASSVAAAPSPPVADTRAEIIWIDIGIKCPGCGCAIQTGEDWIDMGGGTWSPGDIRSVHGCANGCDIRVEIPDMKIKVADGPA